MNHRAHEVLAAIGLWLGVDQIVGQKKILVVRYRDTVPDRDTEVLLAPSKDLLSSARLTT